MTLDLNTRVSVKEPWRSGLELRLPGTIIDISRPEFASDTWPEVYLVEFEQENKQEWLYGDQLINLTEVGWPE